MKTEKKLYRVDINIKYLVYTDIEYNQGDVFNWLNQDMHEGELADCCNITLVNSTEQIKDFDKDYSLYCTDSVDKDHELNLHDVVDALGLDTKKLIERLKKLGYKVTKK